MHNQYAAECTFGAEFMAEKRRAAAETRARARATERDPERDVVPWLRRLGFRADEARRAAALCDDIPNAPERVRVALSFFGSKPSFQGRAAHGVAGTGDFRDGP
jgi:hypothetical protein